MHATLIDWEDTVRVKEIADKAGITLAQAIDVLAAVGELPAIDAIRVVGTAAKRRRRQR